MGLPSKVMTVILDSRNFIAEDLMEAFLLALSISNNHAMVLDSGVFMHRGGGLSSP